MNALDMEAVASRHPELIQPPLRERLALPVAMGVVALYLVFCWWFFSIGKVLGTANWSIAGSYLADWVSYEERPDIDISPAGMTIRFPNNSTLGRDPQPDWLQREDELVTRIVEEPAKADLTTATESKDGAYNFLGRPSAAPAENKAKTVEIGPSPRRSSPTPLSRFRGRHRST